MLCHKRLEYTQKIHVYLLGFFCTRLLHVVYIVFSFEYILGVCIIYYVVCVFRGAQHTKDTWILTQHTKDTCMFCVYSRRF